MLKEFPEDFLFGVATSSYQIEGNSYGNCGQSIWDDFARRKLNGIDGKDACNHYEFYKDDIKLIKEAGFKAYRFSFSWPRLLPENHYQINEKGINFYNRLLDEILKNNLEPFPTLYHWDLPIRFSNIGGWENKDTCKRFADFSYIVSEKFGDKFNNVATINEPWCVSWLSHYLGEHAPGKKNLPAAVNSMHNILLAHGLSLQAMRSSGDYKIGIILNNEYPEPFNLDDQNIQAANLFDSIYNRWFSDAIFRGTYPDLALEVLKSYLPDNYQSDLKIISEPIDWIGVNYYTRSVIKYFKSNNGIDFECLRGNLKTTDMGWELYPEGLSYFIRRMHNEYNDKIPIYVTENGMANNDQINFEGIIDDQNRIEYFKLHLKQLLSCIDEKIKLKGYFAWSLLDNYEWAFGYEKRFGLVHVNYDSFKRTPKNSYKEFTKYLSK